MSKQEPKSEHRSRYNTEQRLIQSVGEIIKKEGYTKLNIQNIAKQAGVDRKLIYTYFGSLDQLVEEYFKTRDYWTSLSRKIAEVLQANDNKIDENLTYNIIENQYFFFKENIEMQNMIAWELSETKPLLRGMADYKEKITGSIFELADPIFNKTNINIRAVNAILVAAVYYLNIHARVKGSTFCQIDINTEEGEQELLKTIKQLLDWTYEHARNSILTKN